MPYRLTDFSKSEKENVKVLMRNLDEMEELGEEWLFRNVEMPPGATPNTADIAFFKHRDRYCIEARPQVTYHGDNPSCKRLFSDDRAEFKTGSEIYDFFRYLAHPPKELPERKAKKLTNLNRAEQAGVCWEAAILLAVALRKIAFEYGLVIDRIDADVIIALRAASGQTSPVSEASAWINHIFCPFFSRNRWTYPGDCHLHLAGTGLFDLSLFPFGKILPLRYE